MARKYTNAEKAAYYARLAAKDAKGPRKKGRGNSNGGYRRRRYGGYRRRSYGYYSR